MKRAARFILCLVTAAAAIACGRSFETYDLKCEGLSEPLAIDSVTPHFSWKIRSSEPMSQLGYQIQVASTKAGLKAGDADIWDSGFMFSGDQVMVPYEGAPLSSRQRCWWRVRIWKSDKESSDWSEPQRFGIGVIGDDTLNGDYIGAVPGDGRSPILRKRFDVAGKPAEALLHVNSLGCPQSRRLTA